MLADTTAACKVLLTPSFRRLHALGRRRTVAYLSKLTWESLTFKVTAPVNAWRWPLRRHGRRRHATVDIFPSTVHYLYAPGPLSAVA